MTLKRKGWSKVKKTWVTASDIWKNKRKSLMVATTVRGTYYFYFFAGPCWNSAWQGTTWDTPEEAMIAAEQKHKELVEEQQ